MNRYTDRALRAATTVIDDERTNRKIEHFINDLRGVKISVDGHRLQELGLTAGPEMRRVLDSIRDAVLDGMVVSPREEEELAKVLIEREQEENSERMVEELGIKPGQVIADIGAGTGYYTRRLAGKAGPAGRVLAEDIQPEMLDLLTNRLAASGITNVTPILGETMDPKLPPRGVDLVLMVDVYHEFEFPLEMMTAICRSLKPGGRVAFVEFRAEDAKVPIKPLHKMTEAQVKKEMALLPLRWIATDSALPWQHILIFEKR